MVQHYKTYMNVKESKGVPFCKHEHKANNCCISKKTHNLAYCKGNLQTTKKEKLWPQNNHIS